MKLLSQRILKCGLALVALLVHPHHASSASVEAPQMLSQALQFLYHKQGGTLGVLQKLDNLSDHSAPTWVQAALMAAKSKTKNFDKGMASGILNAILGRCYLDKDIDLAANVIHEYNQVPSLQPDLVALCLAYATIHRDAALKTQAQGILLQAEQLHPTKSFIGKDLIEKESSANWEVLKEKYEIDLLQDDKEFCVLGKPSGMVCYHANKPANNKRRKKSTNSPQAVTVSLEEALIFNHVPLSSLNEQGHGMVHRLDKGTSGCIVVAKTNRLHACLVAEFFTRQLSKSYQALVVGRKTSRCDENTISLPIDGRPAVSRWSVEQHFTMKTSDSGVLDLTRLRVQTQQGRRHQVRLHCARGLGAPIVLDPLYGGVAVLSNVPSHWQKWHEQEKFALHADKLSIPTWNINVKAPLPRWWQELESELHAND